MKSEDILKLKINQKVIVKSDEHEFGYFSGIVKSINYWTKLVGVVDKFDVYKEYPFRLIKL